MSTRYFFVVALLLFTCATCVASDKVHLKDGRVIEGKVKLIDATSVTIRDDWESVDRVFPKSDVKAIVYENGRVETFETENIARPDSLTVAQRVDSLERHVKTEKAKGSARTEGILIGVGICCAVLLIVALI